MNFTEDLLSNFPAARIAMVTVEESGARREWGFGELNARSAGLAGALEARGVSRGDVVMTLIGNRAEWVLAMLACFRIGAVALRMQQPHVLPVPQDVGRQREPRGRVADGQT